jgi:DNA polymerase-4
MASVGAWKGKPVPVLVLHVDMDAFFAAVEVRSDPRLRGRALVVGGGPGDRGVVTSASYPARAYGVRSGMSLAEARRLCPHLLSLPVDPPKVISASLEVLAVLDRFSPRVEAASIDEAYVEIALPAIPGTGGQDNGGLWTDRALGTGEAIRREVLARCGLSCSVGAGVNKLQAKMATARAKPGGVHAVAPGGFLDAFGASPVSAIPGIGPRTTEALAALGVRTVAQLAASEDGVLKEGFGRWAVLLRGQARGLDARPVLRVGEEPAPRSAGHETTFARDVVDPVALRAALWFLADRVARRLRIHGLAARGVVVRFKVGKSRYSRQEPFVHPTAEARRLATAAWRLLEAARRGRALRLVGVAGIRLVPDRSSPPFLPGDVKSARLQEAGDRLRDRYGERAVLPAAVFPGRGGKRGKR